MSTTIRGITRDTYDHGIVQISLDLTSIEDALRMAAIAVEAGADWLEVGTPLVLAEGTKAVHALRREYPDHPLVADLKVMDGGYGEAKMYGDAGADAVVVMGRAHDATIERVAIAAEETGLLVMGDDMGAADHAAEARRLEDLGVGMVIHHIGHDHRSLNRALKLSPLTDLPAVVAATTVPVQAVGGLSIEQAVGCPALGAGIVVFGAPLAIDDENTFTIPEGDLLGVLIDAVGRVHAAPVAHPA
ncbi:orotidine 5'-phosphate decarboxylase / HUMPS family protein [Humibacter sp.]|jgi:3-hexulose-6-phosphate synthase/6-phospho-3-hexuloisomerase|uniref:orotidine 5'-phosphate decarboxylase / HUMPS family protein n=1 Tax=Humibacter sp. TaxID=1940291 RepID=UPI002B5F1EAF|nr:orotidine 5'-phosphate decarboxylase / HUMPS family protein [Humibacter sp.]HVX06728.1 orotidine 5'-phosphate decarboxylase / HUMPS family protein [Humibacter sp.]